MGDGDEGIEEAAGGKGGELYKEKIQRRIENNSRKGFRKKLNHVPSYRPLLPGTIRDYRTIEGGRWGSTVVMYFANRIQTGFALPSSLAASLPLLALACQTRPSPSPPRPSTPILLLAFSSDGAATDCV